MRWIVLLLAVALAGCFAEPEDTPAEDSPWGVCPQWLAGSPVRTTLAGNMALEVNATDGAGHHLDGFNLQLEGNGTLRFYAGERRLTVTVYLPHPEVRPFLALDGDAEVDVFLSAVTHGTAPQAGPMRVVVEGGPVQALATPWYRVCGASE